MENGGVVEDVSEEYKEYYREKKKRQAKESRERNKERNRIKKEQLANPEHNPDKNYIHRDGAIAGAKRGKPMDFKQADSGNVNPFYGKGIGYSHNCQTCVAVYLARRLGYDVRALPNINNENIYRLSYDTSLAYLDANGKHPKRIGKPMGMRSDMFLERTIKTGEIYSVEFQHKGMSSGHILIAERSIDGNVRLYDPQINQVIENKNINKYFMRTKNIEVMNLTDCTIDEKFADGIMKSNKSEV